MRVTALMCAARWRLTFEWVHADWTEIADGGDPRDDNCAVFVHTASSARLAGETKDDGTTWTLLNVQSLDEIDRLRDTGVVVECVAPDDDAKDT